MKFAVLKNRALALSPLLFIAACSTQTALDKTMEPTASFAATAPTGSVTAAAADDDATTDDAQAAAFAKPGQDASQSGEKLVQVAALAPQDSPLAAGQVEDPAAPTRVRAVAASSRDQECLARARYFESNRSSRDGMLAVGSVVMNRLASGRYGDSVCGVVGAPRQFAPGVLTRSMANGADLALETAASVLKGERHPRIYAGVMHFHTAGYRFGYDNMHYVAVAGGNSFYEKRKRMRDRPNRAQNVVLAQGGDAGRYAKPIQAAFVAPAPSLRPVVVDSPAPVIRRKKILPPEEQVVPGVPAQKPIEVQQVQPRPAPIFVTVAGAKGGRAVRN